jgi:aspartate carbamoyltransferase catalytic subunit
LSVCSFYAGDGPHEHPTQALLDLMMISCKRGKIVSLKVAICGDIAHGRVARSKIYALTKMSAYVTVAGPAAIKPMIRMVPLHFGQIRFWEKIWICR